MQICNSVTSTTARGNRMSKRSRTRKMKNGRQHSFIYVRRQRIPAASFNALTENERYCLALGGHIYNELSLLQRLALITSTHEYTEDLEGQGAFMQTLFFARILLAKLHETKVMLKKEALRTFFESMENYDIEPSIPDAYSQLVARMNRFTWTEKVRNQHINHFPRPNQLNLALNNPDVQWDWEIVHGEKSANTLYQAADVAANLALFMTVNDHDWKHSLETMLDAVREMTISVLVFLEKALGLFVDARLQPLSESTRTPVAAPPIEGFEIPYFFDVSKSARGARGR